MTVRLKEPAPVEGSTNDGTWGEHTICAVASGAGRSAIAVIRLSGPATLGILRALQGREPEPRRASLRRLVDPGSGDVLDRALVLWFPRGQSYTGEDSAELHVHGGSAVVASVLAALLRLGARLAEPGEFTRCAVLSGRMDLTQAEGIADLVAAETDLQRRQALRQTEGALGQLYAGWSARLTRLLAEAEASIEFEDQDLPEGLDDRVGAGMAVLAGELRSHLDDGRRGERLRDGISVAILGLPNAGKSSLLNRLAGRPVAIVSEVAGTTRDIVEARLVLGGVPITLRDTAGLRDSVDPVEAEGVRRARQAASEADLVLLLQDASAPSGAVDAPGAAGVVPELQAAAGQVIRVWTKIDLVPGVVAGLGVSALTGAGFDDLRSRLETEVRALAGLGEAPSVTRQRHRSALQAALDDLVRGLAAPLPELRAEDLRLALRQLGRITGRVDVEAVLNEVFRGFCIGK